jgi:uncharacterized membrane protein YhdT
MDIDKIAIFITKTIIGTMEAFLGVRFLLKILGASQQALFVRWIYSISDSILQPFVGMFPTPSIAPNFVFELNTIFAMLVYIVVGYAMVKFIDFIYKQIVESFNMAGESVSSKEKEHLVKKEETKKTT